MRRNADRAVRALRFVSRLPHRAALEAVLAQHVEDAAVLHATRSALCTAPHVKLRHLRRFDDRLAAHLDALDVAGEAAWGLCEAALETPSRGGVFTAAVRALSDRREDRLDRLFALVQAAPEGEPGLRAAFGWMEAGALRGLVGGLLRAADPLRRLVGVAASAMHRVDPGLATSRLLQDPDPRVRARALRTAGELGKREFVSRIAAAVVDEDERCQAWAAWSAVLLGDRQAALDVLLARAIGGGGADGNAFELALAAAPTASGHAALARLRGDPARSRALLTGSALIGDPAYAPWLISQMADDALARLAGAAFSLITGADLALLDLERKPPEMDAAGPTDDPADDNVEADADDGLPWPDQAKVQAWWNANGARLTQGERHLVGAVVSAERCAEVLRDGYQHQRRLAALHLRLLEPGAALFDVRAPAARQRTALS